MPLGARHHPRRHQRPEDGGGGQAGAEQDAGHGPTTNAPATTTVEATTATPTEQQPQGEVLELVDVGDHAAQQLAVPVGLQPGRGQRLDACQHPRPQVAEGPEGQVVEVSRSA